MKLLELLAPHLPVTRVNAMRAYPYILLIASAKRGNISTPLLRKVVEAAQSSLNTIDGLLTQENFRTIFRVYGSYINDVVAAEVFARWEVMIPNSLLRMKILCRQTAGESLTQWNTIVTAIDRFFGFQWEVMRRLWPEEWAKLEEASQAVRGNPYYGFKEDLGPARSTNFRRLAYVAKELMIKVGGEAALSQYRGWLTDFPGRARIDEMVVGYERKFNSGFTGDLSPRTRSEHETLISFLITTGRRQDGDLPWVEPDAEVLDE